MVVSHGLNQSIARRTRKSLGASPNARTVVSQENATTAFGSFGSLAAGRTKSRSKSLGPGGLDALKVGSGNRRASFAASTKVPRSILKPTFGDPYGSTRTEEAQRHGMESRKSPRKSTPGLDAVDENDGSGFKIAVRTEEEQQAAAREKEERDRRDARRKSLVNRRVSFATEATLHTFHENEYAQDSTTSTDDSRRLSSSSGHSSTSSVAEGVDQPQLKAPIELSTIANGQRLNNTEPESSNAVFNIAEHTTTSTAYSSDSEPMEEVEDVEDEFSASDSDDGSMVTVDAQEVTGTTAASDRTSAIVEDSSLDEVLRVAAQRAATHNMNAREVHGQVFLENEEVIPSFGWVKRAASSDVTLPKEGLKPQLTSMEQDLTLEAVGENAEEGMEMTTAVGQILSVSRAGPPDDEENQTMDVTTAIGAIIRPPAVFELPNLRDSPGDSLHEETAMELTTALGAIHKPPKDLEEDIEDNENMSMELTSVMGGVLTRSRYLDTHSAHPGFLKGEAAPEFHESESVRSTQKDEELTTGMEMTTAMGSILWKSETSPLKTPSRSKIRPPSSSRRSSCEAHASSETVQGHCEQGQRLPQELLSTPSGNISPARSRSKGSPFRRKTAVIMPTQVSSTPRIRRLSGVGADRSGLGSPQVEATLSRRGSIGDTAVAFKVGERSVMFKDPSDLLHKVERERQEQQDKEHQRKILEREVDGAASDASLSVRSMLGGLSPNRNTNRSRKSLLVGSAKGLLGKRPAELDENDDSDENDGVKRLKGYQSSPVKSVRLQQPLKETELGNFRMRSPHKVKEAAQGEDRTPSTFSPEKIDPLTTPRHQRRFKDVSPGKTIPEVNFKEVQVADIAELERQADEEKIHLQDFLNLTSIRFMELTTTKRRHTMVPDKDKDRKPSDSSDAFSLERCVVASACVVPMLELYQHSCRELKKYISEGRQMMKEIEKDTFERNPPLFREYMTASSEVKSLMDGQFKNVKTHARLQSKAMWYEWRMKLQDGLMEGLAGIAEGMTGDQEAFQKQQDLLEGILPAILRRHRSLEEQRLHLSEAARELADCDQSQLDDARQELIVLGEDVIQKKQMIAELRAQCDGWATQIDQLSARKQQLIDEIEKSEAQREKDRGWTANEVCGLQARVDVLKKQHGWALTGLNGTVLSLAYRRDIEFVVDAASFQPGQPSCRIDLWYVGDSRELNAVPKTVEREVFIQCIRDHIRSFDQRRSSISELLTLVQAGWDRTLAASYQVHRLNTTFPTQVTKTSDQSIAVTVSMLSVPSKTKMEVVIALRGHGGPAGLDIGISSSSRVVYGRHLNIARIDEFLTSRLGTTVQQGAADWIDILSELKEKFMNKSKA